MNFEALGVPTVTIVTDPFQGYAQLRAASLGIPNLPLVVVRHPIADKTPSEIDEIAAASSHEVAAALTTPDHSPPM